MSKPFVFISCGQVTDEEKALGTQIIRLVKEITGLDAFFAQSVHDLNGLHTNILNALRDCVAFITVMHPRGNVAHHNGKHHIRGSVWIEQEIAIAAYIQLVENRSLPVIVFIHKSVEREGLRDLLHLNPITFSNESEVLAKLPDLLAQWKNLKSNGIQLDLSASVRQQPIGHVIRKLTLSLVNDTNDVISQLDGILTLPEGVLKHWLYTYPSEVKSDNSHVRKFRFDIEHCGIIRPRTTHRLASFDYCFNCAIPFTGENNEHLGAKLVGQSKVEAMVWVAGKEYSVVRTLDDLAKAAEGQHT